ncbi:rhamnogalacturonan lyase family protein [Nonomuraea rhodomycinica]|uniref:rhamnogalacturonan lyase family protein n=1 Tax=Nonomuraea rhodomycinica TaxID=1712872 RepID=UPI0035E40C6B
MRQILAAAVLVLAVALTGTAAAARQMEDLDVDRFLAGTAYLDGTRPSLIMARASCTRSVIVAWDFRAGALTKRWAFDSNPRLLHRRRHAGPAPAGHLRPLAPQTAHGHRRAKMSPRRRSMCCTAPWPRQ